MSAVIDTYRESLRASGSPKAEWSEEQLTLDLGNQVLADKESLNEYGESYGDAGFADRYIDLRNRRATWAGATVDAISGKIEQKKAGFQAGLGAILPDDFGGDSLMRSAIRNSREAAQKKRATIEDVQLVNDLKSGAQYVTQAAATSLVDMLPAMAASVLGGVAGRKLERMADSKASNLAAEAEKFLGKNWGAKVGAGAGAVGSSGLENTGHVYQELYKYTQMPEFITDESGVSKANPEYLDPLKARAMSLMAGGISGALDSAVPLLLVSKLSKTMGMSKGAASEAVSDMLKGMPAGLVLTAQSAGGEAITESLQEVVQMLTIKSHTKEPWKHGDYMQLVNSGILGAVGGGVVGGGVGYATDMIAKGVTRRDESIGDVALESEDSPLSLRNQRQQQRIEGFTVGDVVTPNASANRVGVVTEVSPDGKIKVMFGEDEEIHEAGLLYRRRDLTRQLSPSQIKNLGEHELEALIATAKDDGVRESYEKALARLKSPEQEEDEDNDLDFVDASAIKVKDNKGTKRLEAVDTTIGEVVASVKVDKGSKVTTVSEFTLERETTDPDRMESAMSALLEDLKAQARKDGNMLQVDDSLNLTDENGNKVTEVYPLDESTVENLPALEVLDQYLKILEISDPTPEVKSLLAKLESEAKHHNLLIERDDKNELIVPKTTGIGKSRKLKAIKLISGAVSNLSKRSDAYYNQFPQKSLNKAWAMKEIDKFIAKADESNSMSKADLAKIRNSAFAQFKDGWLNDEGYWAKETEATRQVAQAAAAKASQAEKDNNLKKVKDVGLHKGHYIKYDGVLWEVTDIDDSGYLTLKHNDQEKLIKATDIKRAKPQTTVTVPDPKFGDSRKRTQTRTFESDGKYTEKTTWTQEVDTADAAAYGISDMEVAKPLKVNFEETGDQTAYIINGNRRVIDDTSDMKSVWKQIIRDNFKTKKDSKWNGYETDPNTARRYKEKKLAGTFTERTYFKEDGDAIVEDGSEVTIADQGLDVTAHGQTITVRPTKVERRANGTYKVLEMEVGDQIIDLATEENSETRGEPANHIHKPNSRGLNKKAIKEILVEKGILTGNQSGTNVSPGGKPKGTQRELESNLTFRDRTGVENNALIKQKLALDDKGFLEYVQNEKTKRQSAVVLKDGEGRIFVRSLIGGKQPKIRHINPKKKGVDSLFLGPNKKFADIFKNAKGVQLNSYAITESNPYPEGFELVSVIEGSSESIIVAEFANEEAFDQAFLEKSLLHQIREKTPELWAAENPQLAESVPVAIDLLYRGKEFDPRVETVGNFGADRQAFVIEGLRAKLGKKTEANKELHEQIDSLESEFRLGSLEKVIKKLWAQDAVMAPLAREREDGGLGLGKVEASIFRLYYEPKAAFSEEVVEDKIEEEDSFLGRILKGKVGDFMSALRSKFNEAGFIDQVGTKVFQLLQDIKTDNLTGWLNGGPKLDYFNLQNTIHTALRTHQTRLKKLIDYIGAPLDGTESGAKATLEFYAETDQVLKKHKNAEMTPKLADQVLKHLSNEIAEEQVHRVGMPLEALAAQLMKGDSLSDTEKDHVNKIKNVLAEVLDGHTELSIDAIKHLLNGNAPALEAELGFTKPEQAPAPTPGKTEAVNQYLEKYEAILALQAEVDKLTGKEWSKGQGNITRLNNQMRKIQAAFTPADTESFKAVQAELQAKAEQAPAPEADPSTAQEATAEPTDNAGLEYTQKTKELYAAVKTLQKEWHDAEGTKVDLLAEFSETHYADESQKSTLDVILQQVVDGLNDTLNDSSSDLVNQSVGLIEDESSLHKELGKAVRERKNPPVTRPPRISQERHAASVRARDEFLGGAEVDGKPVGVNAFLKRIMDTVDPSTKTGAMIQDMALALRKHPFLNSTTVEFRSWNRFKLGARHDGTGGKLTRAYVRGNSIVMGEMFKLNESDSFTDMEALHFTLLEEVAHRVFGTAIDLASYAKRNGNLPPNFPKGVLTAEEAIKLHDDTKAVMAWLRENNDEGKYVHGLLNQHEFWANFATNPEFRKMLEKRMPEQLRRRLQGNKGKFSRIIDWMLDVASRLFGRDLRRANPAAGKVLAGRMSELLDMSSRLAEGDVDMYDTLSTRESREEVPDRFAISPKLIYGSTYEEAHQKDEESKQNALGEAKEVLRPDGGHVELLAFAKAKDLVLNKKLFQAKLKQLEATDIGSEHSVYLDETSGRVIKFITDTREGREWGHHSSPHEYLTDKHNSNFLFGDKTRLEGIVISGGYPTIVTSQPAIIYDGDNKHPTDDQIKEELESYGFRKSEHQGEYELYYQDGTPSGVIIEDAAPVNAILNTDGNINFIDVHIRTPEGTDISEYFLDVHDEEQHESVGEITDDNLIKDTVRMGTMQAHSAAINDFGKTLASAINELPEELLASEATRASIQNMTNIYKKSLPEDVQQLIQGRMATQAEMNEALAPYLEEVKDINDISEMSNRDLSARVLYRMIGDLMTRAENTRQDSKTELGVAKDKIESHQQKLSQLTNHRTMFDLSKVRATFTKAMQGLVYSPPRKGGAENSQVKVWLGLAGEVMPGFGKLEQVAEQLDEEKVYEVMERVSEGMGGTAFVETLQTRRIYELLKREGVTAKDFGVTESNSDSITNAAVAMILGKESTQNKAKAAFTIRLRIAKGKTSSATNDDFEAIKKAARGETVPNPANKELQSVLEQVRQIREKIDTHKENAHNHNNTITTAEKVLEVITERRADLDEYFEATAPVVLHEGKVIKRLFLKDNGEIGEQDFKVALGTSPNSEEAKQSARIADETLRITRTDAFAKKYGGTPMGRYYEQMAKELRKMSFTQQYHTAHNAFIVGAMQSFQKQFSRFGAPGAWISSRLNEYAREYQSEYSRINTQGLKVSKAARRLFDEMAPSGMKMNGFINTFYNRAMHWLNEHPDYQNRYEDAVNKMWKEFKDGDPVLTYTETGRKALRALLKETRIQNDNFQGLTKRYGLSTMDSELGREALITGDADQLYRREVTQGVETVPRVLNVDAINETMEFLRQGEEDVFGVAVNESKGETFDSVQQMLGKTIPAELESLFLTPLLTERGAHSVPFTLNWTEGDAPSVRMLMPEEVHHAWTTATGGNVGIRLANAIQSLAVKYSADVDQVLPDFLLQIQRRSNAIQKSYEEISKGKKSERSSSPLGLVYGTDVHASLNSRSMVNNLPSRFFEYTIYEEVTSGVMLSNIISSAKFGRRGELMEESYRQIQKKLRDDSDTYRNLLMEAGLMIGRNDAPPSDLLGFQRRRLRQLMESKGMNPNNLNKLKEAATLEVAAEKAWAGLGVAFRESESYNQDNKVGLEFLRTVAFGAVNTMKGMWTATMSIPDIVKHLGLNATAFKAVGGSYATIPKEVAGSLLESFGINMGMADRYAEILNPLFGRDEQMSEYDVYMADMGQRGRLENEVGRKSLRKLRKLVSRPGGSKRRSRTEGKYVAGSLRTPFTAPFSYLAQVVNKSIGINMAHAIEKHVKIAAEVLDQKGVSLETDHFAEVTPEELGYKDSTLDKMIFGNVDMIENLNERLTREGLSIGKLAQDYRRRKAEGDTNVLTKTGVLAAYNISMSEVTYDTLSGKPAWTQQGKGIFFGPLLNWSISSLSKGLDAMRNREGHIAMRESIRFMITSGAWLMPIGVAFTLFTDWWDDEVLGKPSSLRKLPPVAAVPVVGIPLAMTDPRWDIFAFLERSNRATNVFGLGQEAMTGLFTGGFDMSAPGSKIEPSRRVLAFSILSNAVAAAQNYFQSLSTGGDWTPDYSNVIRPLMYSMGLNSGIQNAQMITNLMPEAVDYDPTGFLAKERGVADIVGMRGLLRSHAKALGMEMRAPGGHGTRKTGMSEAMREMERAAYQSDNPMFLEAFRKAVTLSKSEDPINDVLSQFKKRTLRGGITRFTMSDTDWTALMSVLDPDERQKIMKAEALHSAYLRSIGGEPTKRKSKNTIQYSERLRSLYL